MSFPTIMKRKFLADLRDRHDDGRGSPSDREIMELTDIWVTDTLRNFLTELAEAGEITVTWNGSVRTILPGRAPKAGAQPVVKRADAPKPAPSRIDLIADAARRIAERKANEKQIQEYPRGASGTARKAPGASVSADAVRIEDRAPPAKEAGVATALPAPPSRKQEWERIGSTIDAARKATKATTHPVQLKIESGMYRTLAVEAELRGMKTGTYIRTIVEEAVNGSTLHAEANDRLRLPTDIATAWQRQSLPLYEFLIEAIRLGIGAMAEDEREEARAA